MNKNVQVLDCTLRDGGYINDWAFGHNVITAIYKRLEKAGVEFIEVGFLDGRRQYDNNRSIFPDTKSLNKVFADVEKHHAIPVAMIDYGTCPIENIGPASESFIDGIRVIFKKDKIDEALPYCIKIKELGYKLFIQAISITAYSDSELLEYVKRINQIKPYAFSIVDTYGLLDNKSMARYFYLIDNNLDPDIKIGYHEHNNFQLGFSNTLKFLEKDSRRVLVADSPIYGMGKSAGNCPTELLAMQMNYYYDKKYDLTQLLEIIDTSIMPIYMENYWGYKLDFYISAMQKCHPSYVQYLLKKKTLSMSSVYEILASIPDEKKLLYDKVWIENAYFQFQSFSIDDTESYARLGQVISEYKPYKIIVIGPGESFKTFLKQYIKDESSLLISINFIPNNLSPDFIFVSNAKRYSQLLDTKEYNSYLNKLIVTSNITPIGPAVGYTLNYASLVYPNERCSDNSLLLFLQALIKINIKEVELVGFDGFDESSFNYYDKYLSFNNIDAEEYNATISEALSVLNRNIKIHFITPSHYVVE